jgi:thioredoxin-dependent peroxiredoxin
MEKLKVGDQAPYFKGVDQNGKTVSLDDFRGKKLILYFYPKDDTPGCTAESCNLNENYEMWLSKGYHIIGVSPDSVKSHVKFIEKYGLRFSLLADEDKTILQTFGAWGEKKLYGKPYMGVLRMTFVLDETGRITDIIEKVDTKNHTDQILNKLEN